MSAPKPAPAASPLVRIEDLHVSYGAVQALRGVSIEIGTGEIVTLIGANGAGKTTLLRTISGLVRPSSGRMTFDGRDLGATPAHVIVAAGLSHVPEGRLIFPDLTVEENLKLGAFLRRDDTAADRERVFTLFPRLRERRVQRAGTLSGGEQQMLAIGRALMSKPRVLLMDEPSLGLAPLLVRQIFDTIREINAAGTTILLVEQNAHMALSVAHRGYVLETGKIVLSGPARDLEANPEVRKAYLGE